MVISIERAQVEAEDGDEFVLLGANDASRFTCVWVDARAGLFKQTARNGLPLNNPDVLEAAEFAGARVEVADDRAATPIKVALVPARPHRRRKRRLQKKWLKRYGSRVTVIRGG